MKTLLRKIGLYLLIASFISNGVCGAAIPGAIQEAPDSDASWDFNSQARAAQAAAAQSQNPEWPGNKTAGQRDIPSAAKDENEEWLENKVVGHRDIQIVCGNSRVIHLNREVARIAIPEPEIADAVVVSKQEVLVTTKKKGAANLLVWDKKGDIYSYNITVVGDPTVLKSALEKISPDNKVDVYSTDKGYVVRGDVGTVETQKQIADASKAFSSDSVSIVTVNEAKQILLEIRVIEIDRNKGLEFGIDGEVLAEKFGFLFMPGGLGPLSAIASEAGGKLKMGATQGMKGIMAASYQGKNWGMNSVIRALENESIVKVLARPNVLVRDGSQATFLVGGEFPIPQVTADSTNVTYKEFGTKLVYTPSILNSGKIRFEIQTEVSELDPANGIQSNGFNMPAITSRKAETTVEIENDKTLMLGGMIQQRSIKMDSGTPYLRRIPWVGKLFSSIENRTDTIELVIFITPHIVDSQKEGFDLRTLKQDDPLYTMNELPDPPFEEAKALAMEEYLTRFENERKAEDGVGLRKFKRDELSRQYQEDEKEAFKMEVDKQEATKKKEALEKAEKQAKERARAAKLEAAEKAKQEKIAAGQAKAQAQAAQKEKEQQEAAEKEVAKKEKEQEKAATKEAQMEAVQEEVVQGDAVQEEVVQGDVVQEAVVQADAVQEAAVQGDAVQEAAVQGDAVQEAVVQADAVQEDVVRNEESEKGSHA